MGVDAVIYAEGDLTPGLDLPLDIEEADGRIYLTGVQDRHGFTLDRYYGPGYERGEWPLIYGAIRLMQAAYPNATVRYGGDSDDYPDTKLPECTPERLESIWQHYLGPHGRDYEARR